jgi:SNF2 family DNA or RNA helicase
MSNFEQKLSRVSPNERMMLQVLSIFWEQITATEFYALLRLLEIKNVEGNLYTMPSLTIFRNTYVDRGILRNVKELWGSGFEIADDTLKEYLTREAEQELWFTKVVEIIQINFNISTYSRWSGERYKLRLLRDYRLSVYMGETDFTKAIFLKLVEINSQQETAKIMLNIFSNPFQNEFLSRFTQPFQINMLYQLFEKAFENSESTAELWEFIREQNINSVEMDSFKLDELIFNGELAAAKELINKPDTFHEMILSGVIALLEKDYEVAISIFEMAFKFWRKVNNKKKGYPNIWQMFLYSLALYKTNESKFFAFAEEFYVYANKNYPEISTHKAVNALESFLRNKNNIVQIMVNQTTSRTFSHKIVECLASAIIPTLKLPVYAKEFATQNQLLGYRWFELELNNLLALKEKTDSTLAQEITENLQSELGFEPVGNSIPPIEDWERVLRVLTVVAENIQDKNLSDGNVNEMRVAWHLNFDRKEIQPVEQKFSKTGWSNGRNIALKRLFELDVKNLTDQDALVVKSAMRKNRDYSYYGSDFYDFDWQKGLAALVGHPNLFLLKNPGVNVQLVKGEPALVVKEIKDDLEISFDTEFTDEGFKVQKETETRYKVLEINKQHIEIANSLQNNKLKIPRKGRESLMKAIQMLSSKIAIHSDLEEHFENLPSVEPENRIHALITPLGDGFHLEFFVKPFREFPPYFKPGKGNESVIADIENVRTRTKRDLANERILLDEIEEACPFLAQFESGNYEWELQDAEACLTAMIELETPRNENKLVIEWTKGQKLKLLGNINFGNLTMNVKGNNMWFDVTGEVKINEDLVISMQELTKLLGNSTNNFVELSDGQFVAITEKLRKHLQSLSAVMDDKNRLHNLRSGILEEFSEELENFKADKAWKDHLERLKAVKNFVPELPATFEADLRPYQVEGFEWLSRLANWGVGACLADDMGLGKTLMALAELVERAEKGAALVVAPVSVCRNWVKEAMRFAPTLNFHIFGLGDRRATVESLGKYDVLVTSYSLLQAEEELFTSQKFATIVLDEAQAIKNRNTKRSKTVMALQGDFRLITTGTPIENHLGELWNLFNFINPGLLGSHEFFNTKFASPIEKDKDDDARKTLQRLIKPFTLRRRKNQVLDDLPAKTEIVLTVEMSEEERAFYESIRREALQKIEATGGEAKDKRFQILAELTRLRLACCHPKLVNENIPLGSSKLDLFGETLDELLDNKHKALVFSQFVKHLKIIETYLKEKGIPYHYLDGSTPAHIRQERIDDFQRGNGEVFLISLKAGGTGLNLTAADYVIHLDPWWNPAVEDQATDRVHRIGQQRPVTVYRLVTENTVEEKILKLHETKRDLADSLLDGTDSSSKLSANDLLALISEM